MTRAEVPEDIDDPNDGLRSAVALRQLADQLEDQYVAKAAQEGWSWTRIAEALNVSRQAVHKKHAARLRSIGITTEKSDNV